LVSKPIDSNNSLFFPADAAESGVLRQGHAYWSGLKGARRFPARHQVTLRGLRGLAKHATLIRVIDGGSDYEFRFVGDVPVLAVGWNFQGRRTSEPEVAAVMQANYRHQLYDEVVHTGEPRLFKCRTVEHCRLKLPMHSETAYFPLGDGDEAVDYLLGFTVFAASAE
jgi:hypothetical protein